MPRASDLLADPYAEALARAERHARVWEPAGRSLLADLDLPADARMLDVGCGPFGWLRALSERVPEGVVVGTDDDELALAAAGAACQEAGLHGVQLVREDRFHSVLPAGMFDLVHARFGLWRRGRAAEQVAAYRRVLKPGGVLVLEEPDTRSWAAEPYAPATMHLVGRVAQAFKAFGGDLDAGRRLPSLLRADGPEPHVRTHVLGLEAGHPYLRLPLELADAVAGRLEDVLGVTGYAALRRQATAELDAPDRRGTTFTLVQAWARVPA
jgi:SAM-dependent methyltransferase